MAKKRYVVLKPLTYKSKFKDVGDKIYLNKAESEVLMNKNLVK